MYSHYEQRQERTSRDFDRNDNTYETMSSTNYRSSMSPRVTNVQRSRPTGLSSPGVSTRIFQSYLSTGNSGNFGPGLASLVHFPGVPLRGGSTSVNTAVVSINTARQRDKRDLENLNDKFAQYVEKVRFLEAHNRKLALEVELLQNRSGQGSSRIKEMYDIEIIEANKLIDDTKRDAAITNDKKKQAEQELHNQKTRYNNLASLRETDRREIDAIQLQIAENEAQIALFRRRMADLEDEYQRYKAEAQRLSSEIACLQKEIQNELFLKSSCEVEKLALEDDLINLKHLHEADLAELRSKSISNDLDPSQFFRNELSEAIREIRNEYETTTDNQRSDLQNRYSLSTNEIVIRTQQRDANPLFNEQQRRQVERVRNELVQIQNQNNYLRQKNLEIQNSIIDLKQKMKDLNNEDISAKMNIERDINEARRRLERVEHIYTDATAFTTSLEKEIATYRELLESPTGLRGCADRILQNAEQNALDRPSNKTNRADGTIKTTTRTVLRTYINATGSNSDFENSNTLPSVNNSNHQSTPASGYYQTLSNTYRTIPIRDDTIRNHSSRNSPTNDYNLRDSTIRDDTIRNHSSRNSPINDYNRRDSIIREYSSNRNSSIHERSSSHESSVHENIIDDNRQSPEYDTLLDT